MASGVKNAEQRIMALYMAIAALRPVSREKMERYGDTRVVSVTGEMPEQMQIWRK